MSQRTPLSFRHDLQAAIWRCAALFLLLIPGSNGSHAQGRLPNCRVLGASSLTAGFGSAAFTPDGKQLVCASQGEMDFVDARTGMLGRTIHISGGYVAKCSRDGKFLVLGGAATEIRRIADGSLVARVPIGTANVRAVALSPDNSTLAIAGTAGTVMDPFHSTLELWSVARRKRIDALDASDLQLTSLAFSPDGKMLAGAATYNRLEAAAGEIITWSVATHKTTTVKLQDDSFSPWALDYLANGKTLVVAGSGRRGSVALYDAATLKATAGYLPDFSARALSIAPDGKTAAVCGQAYSAGPGVAIVDLSTGKALPLDTAITTGGVACFSPDGTRVLVTGTGNDDAPNGPGKLQICLTKTGAQVSDISPKAPMYAGCVAISPDGSMLAAGGYSYPHSEGAVQLLNVSSGAVLERIPTPASDVTSVAFAPDGRTLLVVGWHSNNGNDTSPSDIELWSIPEKRVLQSFKSQVRYLDTGAFSPDGTMVAVTGTVEIDGPAKTMVEIWQVATGALLRRLSSSAVNLSSVKFSPDGSLLVAAGTQGLNHDNDIGILEAWSVLDGRLIRTLTSPTNQGLSDVAFAPDGNTIAAAGGQGPDATSRGIVDIWNLRTGRHVKRVKVGDKYAISLQYSGAGGVILVGTNKRLCVYDAHTGSLRRYYDQETGSVCSLSLGPHRASLAYRRIDGRIVVADNPYAGTYRFKR